MKRKFLALLLALCVPLTLLTGCGGNGAADAFLDTLKEIKTQSDVQIELLSTEDDTWSSGTKLTGTLSQSNGQGDLTLTAFTQGDKTLGTMGILVDGTDIYLQLEDWITYLIAQYQERNGESEEYTSDIQQLQQFQETLDGRYVKLTAKRNLLSLSEEPSDASAAFSKWYDGLGKELKGNVKEQEGRYTLSLKEDALETVKTSWLTQLTQQQEAYCDALSELLSSVEETLAMMGWSSQEYLENAWVMYQEELTELEENGVEEGAALTMTVQKQEDGVYQLTVEEQGDQVRYLKGAITPLDTPPEQLTLPEKALAQADVAEALSELYLSNQILSETGNASQTTEDIPDTFDWDARYEAEGDDTMDYGTELDLEELEGYTYLKSLKMMTEDGKKTTLPMVTGAEYTEADQGDGTLPYSVYQSHSGWEGNVYDIELANRSLKEILQESADTYVDVYQNEWEYAITQPASQVQTNQKGTACVVGFGYHETERDCDVTWISILTQVKGSQYAVAYEYAIYADNAETEIVGAMKELCQYFGLDLPVTVKTK